MIDIWFIITTLGDTALWVAISIALVLLYMFPRLLIWKGRRHGPKRKVFKKFLIIFLISLYVTFGLTYAVKATLDVPRICSVCPAEGCNPYCPPDASFPSGHSATSFVFFTCLALVTRKRWTLPLFVVPALVAASRYVLGVHTILDLIGGVVLSILVSVAVAELLPVLIKRA
jgi:membrane-associated phospholipid phosphatase